MLINSLKDLDKLMQLCRKRGIASFEIDGMKFTIDLSVGVEEKSAPLKKDTQVTTGTLNPFDPTVAPTGEQIKMPDALTPEQLLMWSAGSPIQNQDEQ